MVCFWTSPEWSLKMAYVGSNPGNLNGFKTKWMKERLENIKFLDVTTSMLPYGVPFPMIPETPEIMNIVVPDMLQNALTGTMTVDQAAEDAAKKVKNIMSGGNSRRAQARPAAHSAAGPLLLHQGGRIRWPRRHAWLTRPRGHQAEPSGVFQRICDHRADYLYVLPALVVMLIVIAYPDLLHDRAVVLQYAAQACS